MNNNKKLGESIIACTIQLSKRHHEENKFLRWPFSFFVAFFNFSSTYRERSEGK